MTNQRIGYFLVLVLSLNISTSAILTKKLSNVRIHYSLICLYSSSIGIPVSLLLSIIAFAVNYGVRDLSEIYETSFIIEVIYLILSGITGNLIFNYKDGLYYHNIIFSLLFLKY